MTIRPKKPGKEDSLLN